MKYAPIAVLVVLLLIFVWVYFTKANQTLGFSHTQNHVQFFDAQTFYPSVRTYPASGYPHKISGMIIPHHLFASSTIAQLLSRAVSQHPKQILIIGPNHSEVGHGKWIVSRNDWNTDAGTVPVDKNLVTKILQYEGVEENNQALIADHSVSGIIPFVALYFPDAQIVPILVSGRNDNAGVTRFVQELHAQVSDDALIIAAVDFSHGLVSYEAEQKDAITSKVLAEYNFAQLFRFDNTFTDSTVSLAVLLKLMQLRSTTRAETLLHTNSGIMSGSLDKEVTSYFGMIYYE